MDWAINLFHFRPFSILFFLFDFVVCVCVHHVYGPPDQCFIFYFFLQFFCLMLWNGTSLFIYLARSLQPCPWLFTFAVNSFSMYFVLSYFFGHWILFRVIGFGCFWFFAVSQNLFFCPIFPFVHYFNNLLTANNTMWCATLNQPFPLT